MDGQEYAANFSRFLIIGGGISGLAAASTLAQRGVKDFRYVYLHNHIPRLNFYYFSTTLGYSRLENV